MLDQITKSVVQELCNKFNRLYSRGLVGMIVFLFGTQDMQGQCSITSSLVRLSGPGSYCPNSSFSVSLNVFNNQTYTFFHNGEPIPGYIQLSNIGPGPRSLSYAVSNMSASDAGSYSVIAYDTCGDGNSLTLNTVFAYYEGIAGLSIDVVENTAVSFHWSVGPPGSTYSWTINNTAANPPPRHSLFSGNTTDTTVNVTGLLPGVTYYLLVSIQNSPCFPRPLWTAISFTTPNAPCTVNFDSAPSISSINPNFTICPNGQIVLQSNSSSGNQWFRDAVLIPNSVSSTFTAVDSGSYSVMVTDPSGCYATSPAKIVTIISAPPVPTITASGPLTFCAGGSVVLSSSAASSYLWYLNGTTTGQTSQNLTATSSGTYSVQVSNSGGCSATSLPTIVDANLGSPAPVITPLGSLTFCAGGNVVLSSSTANGYAWFRNDTAIGQFTQNLTVAGSGNYTVQVTNTGGCLATSNPTTVNVNPIPPIPTISGQTVLNSCTESADTLLSSAQGGNQWLSNNVAIPGESNVYLIVYNSGNYSVQVTSTGGCTSVSASTAVTTVGSSPQPTISPTGTITICAGDSTLLSSSLPSGNQWYKDAVALPGDTAQKLYVTASGNYTVLGGTGGCANQSVPTIISISGTLGTPKITVNGSLTICQGGSILLQSSVQTGNQWYFNGQALFGENNTSYSASAPGNYIVAVGTGACQVFSTAVIVTQVAVPSTPLIAYNNTDLCSGTVVLQSSSDSLNQWYLDSLPISGATAKTFTPLASGNYAVMVGFGSNCSSQSAPVTITGSSGQIPIITILNGVLSSDSLSYNQWYLNDSIIPGATHNIYTPKVPGSYTLRFNHNGCLSDFSAPFTVTTADLTTPNVSIFPNPATDHMTIVNRGANPIMLQLYDMAGRGIWTVESVLGTYQIPTYRLTRGPYYLLITDQINKNKTRQLIMKL
jgi:hypothetical protein